MEKIVEFLRKKDYKYIKDLGCGSFGKTVLLKDEDLDMLYACKKYQPTFDTQTDYFDKFISEIKILNNMLHENIVRIYNSYLYAKAKTGYILMEYVEGMSITEYIAINPQKLEEIFEQLISAFKYLESKNICHRDIRASNILINTKGIVKLIDFGFGKEFNIDSKVGNPTIKNNWICDLPNEMNIDNPKYDNITDMYFLGNLINQIIQNNKIDFKYQIIVDKMKEKNKEKRYKSFAEISLSINDKNFKELSIVDEKLKQAYQNFIKKLENIIDEVCDSAVISVDASNLCEKLMNVYDANILEDYVIDNSKLIGCFITGKVRYFESRYNETQRKFTHAMPIKDLKDFINILNDYDDRQIEIVAKGIENRINKIERFPEIEDDLPF